MNAARRLGLSAMPHPLSAASEPERLLIVKLSSLGDLVHALPAVHALKTGLRLTVDWAVHAHFEHFVRCFTDVDGVIPIPRKRWLGALPHTLERLQRRAYRQVVDLQGLLKSALVARAARGAYRLGPTFHREGSRLFYNAVAAKAGPRRHAVDEALDAARFFGLPTDDIRFPLEFPPMTPEGASPRVAFIVRSRWETKNWAAERFGAVAAALQQRLHAGIFLVGAAGDSNACSIVSRDLRRQAFNYCGHTDLVEMGSLIQNMDLVIGVDSGPLHLAAALGKPVIGIYGSTDPARTGPYGEGHRVIVREGLDCRPCHSRHCARGDVACLTELPAEAVIEAAVERLRA